MATVHNRCIMPHFLRIISVPLGVPFPSATVYNIPSLKASNGRTARQPMRTNMHNCIRYSADALRCICTRPYEGAGFRRLFQGPENTAALLCCAYGVGLPKMVKSYSAAYSCIKIKRQFVGGVTLSILTAAFYLIIMS